jgi:8-oxo-dGTP diphosphatase
MLIVVAASLMNTQRKVLLQQRPRHKAHGGLWEFPGGKREGQETPEITLQRELLEELDIHVALSDMRPCHFVTHPFESNLSLPFSGLLNKIPATDNQMFLLLLYHVQQWKGTITAKEGQPLRWVDAQEIQHYPMPPADIPFLDYIWQEKKETKPYYKTEVA